ncbi:RagB/SusD family nutrient uptake outer membrane protein [uncultured Chitinophaga sp.]|jgi:SusD family.|uniref:RagB/SusD family nutrient uptake outer membrane protein n=1 Tax=uncultured Chitinophaga sp. TaxID=339340 RepID=UPI00261E9088|nr:RagB/SusD family nutrient uptake outer membrane protein [uncultured Chitinophaga sp.]
MKRYIKLLLIPVSLLLLTVGCKKNFLDSKPLDRYSDADVWEDSTLANLFLNNIYAGIPTEFAGTMTDALSDELYSSSNISVYQGTFLPASLPYALINMWDNSWSKIRRCNMYLENVNRLPASDVFKKRTADEVRFLRALYYSYLANYFGAVPLITATQDLNGDLNVSRTPYAGVVSFITKQLDSIYQNGHLPFKYAKADMGRVTRGAALALKSRVLLYAAGYDNNWQAAYDAAKAVIDIEGQAGYGLFPQYETLFHEANDNNLEVIFDHQYLSNFKGYHVHHYNLPWGLVPPGPSALNQPTQNIVDEYEMANGKMINESGSGYDAAQPYVNRDPRFYASIFYDGAFWSGTTLDFKLGSNNNPSSSPLTTGYALRKMQEPTFNPFDLSKSYGGGQNNILLRYAEVLLNAAEAAFELGRVEEARGYINRVRNRAGMPEIPAGQLTLDKIRHERTIELAFEGTRLWDIRRWKLGPQKLGVDMRGVSITESGSGAREYNMITVQSRSFSDKMYLFPIYQTEIDKNPNLKPNNPGW